MIEFTVDTKIARPPANVFAYVTNPSKLPTWQTNAVSSEIEGGGLVGVGTRLREVHRVPGGKLVTSLVEVADYEPDQVFALHVIEGALPLDPRILFEATGRAPACGSPLTGGRPARCACSSRAFAGL